MWRHVIARGGLPVNNNKVCTIALGRETPCLALLGERFVRRQNFHPSSASHDYGTYLPLRKSTSYILHTSLQLSSSSSVFNRRRRIGSGMSRRKGYTLKCLLYEVHYLHLLAVTGGRKGSTHTYSQMFDRQHMMMMVR